MNDLWQACASHLESELPAQLYRTWIKPLVFLGYDEGANTLKLGAPNRVKLDWVRAQYGDRIGALAAQLISPETRVSFEISAGAESDAHTAANGGNGEHNGSHAGVQGTLEIGGGTPLPGFAAQTTSQATGHASERAADERAPRPGFSALQPSVSPAAERSRLNPDLTFETFVTGKANDLARAAALQVAERPGGAYNPLFLYGGVGLGKTHLIHAVGNGILQRAPGANIRYITANQFFQDMVASIRRQSVDEFKRYYQSLDLLLIDDIQFFAGKERSQEEFFYAFENLIAERKQIIITSDTYPKEMSGIDDRLISRFNSGLIVAIEPPELEMRVAILMRKAEFGGHPLDEDVAFFVAKHIRQNVRELEGALRRILAYAQFRNQPITLELVKEALKDLLSFNRGQISVEFIQKTVADFYKMKVADMYSKRRPANIALPRQIAMYLAKELTQKRLPEIGELFGGRDHTTVLHAVRKIAELRQHRPELNHQIHVLEQTLREYL
ncbi:MAG: chromosomal replication initiator protein DnaA [Burkholderiales bacterium]|nr:chromosomal replication initiator protein DnaA [Burkholderiales bacterium]